MSELIGKTISHYRILEKVGQGGMGVIYKAEDTKLKRTVALKFLPHHLLASAEEKTRFFNEAQAASALNHPNIMTIFDIEEIREETFIAMEYLEGETLVDKLSQGPLKTKELLNIAIAVADGLHAAHEQDIVHRDVKSENIMISKTGQVKIMDFGLAKRKGMSRVTKIGTTLGTLAYMSPEQAEGLEVDYRSDIFSFGVVMYEMATGRLPFRGEHEAAILYSIVNEIPLAVNTANPNTPQELGRIIHKALEKESEDRYQHADELLSDLKKLKKDLESDRAATTAFHVPVTEIQARKQRWYKPAYLLAATMIIILIIVGFPKLLNRNPILVVELQENSLAVLYFENLKDPQDGERLGQILQELIIADLSETPLLKVFSSQRLFDVQKQLGSKDRKKIDPGLATEIAQRVGAQTMLIGNVIQAGDRLILTSQLVDSFDGTVIGSQRVEGTDIFAMVDVLAVHIQDDLKIPTTETDRVEIAVKEKTTPSVSAYQYYLAGSDLFNDSKFDSAIVQFEKAIALDSTFTQAFYKMAIARWWSQSETSEGSPELAKEALMQILSGSWYTSTKEKYLAQGAIALINQDWNGAREIYQRLVSFIPDEKEAWYGLAEANFHGVQNYDDALDALEKVLVLDPGFTLAYRHIFDIYNYKELYDRGIIRGSQFVTLYPEKPWGYYYLGRMFTGKMQNLKALDVFTEAVEKDPLFSQAYDNIFNIYIDEKLFDQGIKKGLELVERYPDKLWSYKLLGAMYRVKGDFNSAIDTYQEGLLMNPQAYRIINELGYTYQLRGNYNEAKQSFSALTGKDIPKNWQYFGAGSIGAVYIEQGQYRKAQEYSTNRLILSKSLGKEFETGEHLNLAYLHFFLGENAAAFSRLDSVFAMAPNINTILFANWVTGMIHAQSGQIEELNSVIEAVQTIIEREQVSGELKKVYNVLLMERFILLDETDQALIEYENLKTVKFAGDRYLDQVALLHLKKGNYEQAFKITEEMQSTSILRDARPIMYPRSFYILGRIYEEMGQLDQAQENYEKLLNLWRNGDEEISERKDALNRLARLRKQLG